MQMKPLHPGPTQHACNALLQEEGDG